MSKISLLSVVMSLVALGVNAASIIHTRHVIKCDNLRNTIFDFTKNEGDRIQTECNYSEYSTDCFNGLLVWHNLSLEHDVQVLKYEGCRH